MSRAPRAGCILINPGGKLLVVKEVASGLWGFPKGGRKRNETMVDAALRELREETGKVIMPSSISAIVVNGRNRLYVVRGNFPMYCIVDKLEIDDYGWVTIDELKRMNISNFTKKCIGKARVLVEN